MNADQVAQYKIAEDVVKRMPKDHPYHPHSQQLLEAWRSGDLEAGSQLKELLSNLLLS